MRVYSTQVKVFYAPTARRRFFTKRAAVHCEARAMIERKYPTERAETDEHGRATYRGWHWSEDARLVRLHARLVRLIAKHEG